MSEATEDLRHEYKVGERYEIKEQIARGGMSVLFRAGDTTQGIDVCLKFPHRAVGERLPDLKLLKKEFNATVQLNSDHIVM